MFNEYQWQTYAFNDYQWHDADTPAGVIGGGHISLGLGIGI